jgi:rhamnosyltransferase
MTNICAATVILYNPEDDVFENIISYAKDVAKIIVVDNSTKHNKELITKLENALSNLLYINNNANLGIATALNIGCYKAIELGYEWILTMDQDSRFINFPHYLSCLEKLKEDDSIAILAANTNYNETMEIPKTPQCNTNEVLSAITSANFVNLKKFTEVGGFDNKLFIDLVDYDFSLKMNEAGYKIYELPFIYVKHSLGEIFHRKNLITRKVRAKIEHNPQRVYYFTRNYLYVAAKHRQHFPKQLGLLKTLNMLFIHQVTKIILYEDKKFQKIKAKFLGLIHYLSQKFGKYDL